MIDSPAFWLAAVPAVLIVGLSKGGFGGGLGVLGVPLLSLAVSPVQAAAVLLPVLCVMDLASLWAFRHVPVARQLRRLLPGALLGILAGAWAWQHVEVAWVKLIVGIEALASTAHHVWQTRGGRQPPARAVSVTRSFGWGALAGFTSYLAHAGGPPLAACLLPQRLPRAEFIGVTVFFFAVVNYTKLVPYALLGQLGDANLVTAAALLPLALVGVRLGVVLHARLPEKPFYAICYAGLALTGAKLLWDALAALGGG